MSRPRIAQISSLMAIGSNSTHVSPRRNATEINALVPCPQNKHMPFGQQEGACNGCGSEFPFHNFTSAHIIPQRRGGTGHIENIELLYGHCNSVKSDRPQEYLVSRLRGLGGAA